MENSLRIKTKMEKAKKIANRMGVMELKRYKYKTKFEKIKTKFNTCKEMLKIIAERKRSNGKR